MEINDVDDVNTQLKPLSNEAINNIEGESRLSWHIISLLSWLFLLISIVNSYSQDLFFWEIFLNGLTVVFQEHYFPLQMMSNLLKILVLAITLTGFIVYLIFTTYKKNQNLYDGMLTNASRFHFIPLLFISALFIDGSIAQNNLRDMKFMDYHIVLFIIDLVFTIIALISLLIIYIKTNLDCDWYIVFAIKKGTYSTFIVLLFYNFLNAIECLRAAHIFFDYYHATGNYWDLINKKLKEFNDTAGIILPSLFGIMVLIFSCLFKDLMALFVNIIIDIEMIIGSYSHFGGIEGTIDVLSLLISLFLICCIANKCTNRLF